MSNAFHTLCDQTVHFDCRHFVGDRPCAPHKAKGVKCAACADYDPVSKRVLVIKLGAMGDVLRTTSILPSLRRSCERPFVTWITAPEPVDLLEHNPYVDSVVAADSAGIARLCVERFDLVINPEASRESGALASLVQATEKRGFGLSPEGTVSSLNRGAEELFLTGLFDDVKKRNVKTYEELVCQLAELPCERSRPTLLLTEGELRFASEFRRSRQIDRDKRIIGINTGGGGRWQLKRWTASGFADLARRLSERSDLAVLLLGGPAEQRINEEILAQPGVRAIDGGCFNSARNFAVLVGLCDVLVTGDSLALHMGLALGRRVVVLFGPTSAAEIDLYDLGEKILPPMGCLSCYRSTCDKKPNCMDSISVEAVYTAVEEQLARIRTA
jgi:ADP-heptose:LPS heptosyltransferase